MRELLQHEKDFIEQLKIAPFYDKIPMIPGLIKMLENTGNEHEFALIVYTLKGALEGMFKFNEINRM